MHHYIINIILLSNIREYLRSKLSHLNILINQYLLLLLRLIILIPLIICYRPLLPIYLYLVNLKQLLIRKVRCAGQVLVRVF